MINGNWQCFRRNCWCNCGCFRNNMGMNNKMNQSNINVRQPAKPDCEPKPCSHEPNDLFMKSASLGSMIIPADTRIGSLYHIASINMQTARYGQFHIKLSFSCNIMTTNAKINLSFQMYKQGNSQLTPVPISCNYEFCRNKASNETNTFSFIACDYDLIRYQYCNYSVYAKVTGMATSGATSVTNSMLSASLVEVP